jgi:hypothetical protein
MAEVEAEEDRKASFFSEGKKVGFFYFWSEKAGKWSAKGGAA